MNNIAIVIGASGGISQAIIQQLLDDQHIDTIFAISRSISNECSATEKHPKLVWLQSDNSDVSMQECINQVKKESGAIRRVFITNGILQTENIRPERALKSLSSDNLHGIFHINTVIPSLWLAALTPLLICNRLQNEFCVVSVLSARVGSITDNKLGGWHSYRASKTALNMILKGASIEFERKSKDVRLIAFHPGTTDTNLSKPFQASIPKETLFTPAFVAKQLLTIMESVALQKDAKPLSFLDWENKSIEW